MGLNRRRSELVAFRTLRMERPARRSRSLGLRCSRAALGSLRASRIGLKILIDGLVGDGYFARALQAVELGLDGYGSHGETG